MIRKSGIIWLSVFWVKFYFFRRKSDSINGAISCSAENKIGRQRNPCYFELKSASKKNKSEYRYKLIWQSFRGLQMILKWIIWHYVPARPDKPTRCKVYNGSRAVEVRCSPGYDGGRSQQFKVEVIRYILQQNTENQT